MKLTRSSAVTAAIGCLIVMGASACGGGGGGTTRKTFDGVWDINLRFGAADCSSLGEDVRNARLSIVQTGTAITATYVVEDLDGERQPLTLTGSVKPDGSGFAIDEHDSGPSASDPTQICSSSTTIEFSDADLNSGSASVLEHAGFSCQGVILAETGCGEAELRE